MDTNTWHDIRNGPTLDHLTLAFRSEFEKDIIVQLRPFRIVHHYTKGGGYESMKVKNFRISSLAIGCEKSQKILIVEGNCEVHDSGKYSTMYFLAEYNPNIQVGRIKFSIDA